MSRCRICALRATWAISQRKNVSGVLVYIDSSVLTAELGFLLSKGGNGIKKDMRVVLIVS